MEYRSEYLGHDDEGYMVMNLGRTLMVQVADPNDAETLVGHLNFPRDGAYVIVDTDADKDAVLCSPEGDVLYNHSHRPVLESLLEHLNRAV